MNYRVTLQYDGTDFHGWQIQSGQRTVQGELSRVLELLDGDSVVVHGSGRTDAGVHAEGQVASVVLRTEFDPCKLRFAINGNLDADVRVMSVAVAPKDFHARYSAKGKTYCYRIVNGRFISPFWNRYAHHEVRRLNPDLMRESANLFAGRHDWTAFSSAQADAASRVRTISLIDVTCSHNVLGNTDLIEITVSADGFLRSMVRSIAGTLIAVGCGDIDGDVISRAIETGDRDLAGATAPARGLTLVSVQYD